MTVAESMRQQRISYEPATSQYRNFLSMRAKAVRSISVKVVLHVRSISGSQACQRLNQSTRFRKHGSSLFKGKRGNLYGSFTFCNGAKHCHLEQVHAMTDDTSHIPKIPFVSVAGVFVNAMRFLDILCSKLFAAMPILALWYSAIIPASHPSHVLSSGH